MKNLKYTLIVALLLVSQIYGQTDVKLSLQVRPRMEVDARDFNSNTDAFSSTFLRTRFGANFTNGENVSAFVQIQDSRIYGTEPNTLTSTNNVDLHQAYFTVKNVFNIPLEISAGRMEFNLGPQRLVGAVGWHNVGRSFDGTTLKLTGEKVDFSAFAFQTVERQNVGDSLDQSIIGLYADLKMVENYKIQPFVIAETEAKANNVDRYTLGVFVKGGHKAFFHETEFALQTGKLNTGGREQDIKAMMFAFNAGYKFEGKVKPVLGAGIDYLSGDDDATDNDYKVFNTLYATNHKYYGFMDYFLNIPAHTYGAGLTDIHARFSFMPYDKFTAEAKFHIFKGSEDLTLIDGTTSNNFGSELDITLAYAANKNLKVVGGLSFFTPGDVFKERRGEDSSSWAYLMAIVNL